MFTISGDPLQNIRFEDIVTVKLVGRYSSAQSRGHAKPHLSSHFQDDLGFPGEAPGVRSAFHRPSTRLHVTYVFISHVTPRSSSWLHCGLRSVYPLQYSSDSMKNSAPIVFGLVFSLSLSLEALSLHL